MRGASMDKTFSLHVKKHDQWLIDTMIAIPKRGKANRVRFRALSAVRQARLRFSDPLVCFRMGELRLLLPLSHELPFYRRNLPDYAMNLETVVIIVHAKYRNLTMIDTGANVGDSVAVIRAVARVPILCIEGEERFFRLLRVNTMNLVDIELEQAFVGAHGDQIDAVHAAHGTAHIELGTPAGGKLRTHTLSEAIDRHPRFAGSKLLKLDVEGFDCKIISSESRFLARNKPVVFFEYHPPLCKLAGYDPFPVFMSLAKIGYSVVAIYENTGRYLFSVELNQRRVLEDIHAYLVRIGGFCDLVAFHSEDRDIAESVRKRELDNRANWSIGSDWVNAEECVHAD